jgi:hypothetical protein
MMLPGLPLLTADDHEFQTRWDGLEKRKEICPERNDHYWYVSCTVPPDGVGWTLVGFSTSPQGNEGFGCCLWARRKDGRPLVCNDDGSIAKAAAAMSAMAKTRDELVKLARAATDSVGADALTQALDELSDWIKDYDATRGDR